MREHPLRQQVERYPGPPPDDVMLPVPRQAQKVPETNISGGTAGDVATAIWALRGVINTSSDVA